MFPGNPTFNPYWTLLARAIAKAAPETEVKIDAIWFFRLRDIFDARRGPSIIHIHWLHEYSAQYMRRGRLPKRLRVFWGYAAYAAYFALMTYMKVFRGAKVVWTVHNADVQHIRPTWSRFFQRWADMLTDAYIFHCEKSRRHFMTGKKRKPSFVIPHVNFIGVYGPIMRARSTAREMLGIPTDATVFLVIGIIRAAKNLEWLLGALRRMPHRNIRIIIAGHPVSSADKSLIRRYRRVDDERFIFIPRFIPDPQMRWLFAAADYLLNAQTRGYVSGATVTALSYGLPALNLRWGCASSIIRHGKNGFLFTENNVYPAIDEAIAMRYNKNAYARMHRAAYESARGLSWDAIARQTITAYRTIRHEK